eukprot:TRINITY_DN110707_c0_g1_i1.p3 TRINITY_DN110707_c0_g1~~TRINITY_DN110707_c0_g1_i1.p3  ORF type:complete len:171 (-),score=20.00 TRINITY_DN110707_c0_g1_i1:213-725(-)
MLKVYNNNQSVEMGIQESIPLEKVWEKIRGFLEERGMSISSKQAAYLQNAVKDFYYLGTYQDIQFNWVFPESEYERSQRRLVKHIIRDVVMKRLAEDGYTKPVRLQLDGVDFKELELGDDATSAEDRKLVHETRSKLLKEGKEKDLSFEERKMLKKKEQSNNDIEGLCSN